MRHRIYQARFALTYVVGLVLFFGALQSLGCGPKPDLSQLTPQGLSDYRRLQAIKGVNDVTTAVIAAHKANNLTTGATARVLTINQQVLDVINANPQGFREKAVAVVTNARQALPADLNAQIGRYLDMAIAALNEVTQR